MKPNNLLKHMPSMVLLFAFMFLILVVNSTTIEKKLNYIGFHGIFNYLTIEELQKIHFTNHKLRKNLNQYVQKHIEAAEAADKMSWFHYWDILPMVPEFFYKFDLGPSDRVIMQNVQTLTGLKIKMVMLSKALDDILLQVVLESGDEFIHDLEEAEHNCHRISRFQASKQKFAQVKFLKNFMPVGKSIQIVIFEISALQSTKNNLVLLSDPDKNEFLILHRVSYPAHFRRLTTIQFPPKYKLVDIFAEGDEVGFVFQEKDNDKVNLKIQMEIQKMLLVDGQWKLKLFFYTLDDNVMSKEITEYLQMFIGYNMPLNMV